MNLSQYSQRHIGVLQKGIQSIFPDKTLRDLNCPSCGQRYLDTEIGEIDEDVLIVKSRLIRLNITRKIIEIYCHKEKKYIEIPLLTHTLRTIFSKSD